MLRFVIFFILFVILITLCVYYKEKMGSKIYILVITIIIITSISAFVYTAIDNSSGEFKQEILVYYKEGKTLTCDGINVNFKTHSFNQGTSVFIDKNTNQKIDLYSCKLSN